jgi:hypothetical protein
MSDCIPGSSRDAPMPPMIAQKTITGSRLWVNVMEIAPTPYPHRPRR